MYLEFDKNQGSSAYQRFLLTPKLFVFFYSSSMGCLIPFLPVFFRLNGMSAIQTGLLLAARYFILCWSAPTLSFIASKMNARKCVLVLAVLFGALSNITFLLTASYKGKLIQHCADIAEEGNNKTMVANSVSTSSLANQSTNVQQMLNVNIINQNNPTKVMFNSSIEQEIFDSTGLKLDKQFLIFLLIISAGTFMSSPAKPLHELVSLAIVKEFKASYNVQRLFSVVGWSVVSLTVAVVVYKLPCSFTLSQNVFNVHFGFHLLFTTTALIFAVIMKAPSHKITTKLKFYRVLKVACKNANCIITIIAMGILGTAQFVVSTYLFWYIQDLGGNEVHMGLTVLVSGLSQIPLLFLTKYLIHWLGHGWMFFITMFAYAVRFILYSFTNRPMMVIPIEFLHSLTSSSIWLTSMSLAVLVAPIGSERSMQNLFTTSYGFGMGIGGVVASIAYQLYGPVHVFECSAAICALYALVLAVLQCLVSPPDDNHGFLLNGDYYKASSSTNNQSDWLLDALNAEEEIEYSRS